MSPITQSDLLLRAAGDSFLDDPVRSGLVLVGPEFVSHSIPIVLFAFDYEERAIYGVNDGGTTQ